MPSGPETHPALGWRRIYLGVSGLLVLATVAYLSLPEFAQKSRLLGPFFLGAENNVGVWWSAISLFTAALLAFELACSRAGLRVAWSVLSFLCFGLACDELGSLHERIGSWREYAPLALALAPLLGYVLVCVFRDARTRASAPFLVAGFGCFAGVAGMEWLGDAFVWPEAWNPLRVGFEEGLELFGEFLILQGLVQQRTGSGVERRFRAVVPRPSRMTGLIALLASGLVVHVALLVWVVPRIDDHRGNPGALFPAFVFFLLFAAAFWRGVGADAAARSAAWRGLAAVAVICSAAEVYSPARLVPKISSIAPLWVWSDPYVVAGLQLFLVLVFWRGRMDMLAERKRALPLLLVLLVVTVPTLFGADPGPLVRGALPYILAVFLL